MKIPLKRKKYDLPDTQLNYLEGRTWYLRHRNTIRLSKSKMNSNVLNPTNIFWKYLVLYWSNLILDFNQGLALFIQKQILKSNENKSLQKQNNEDSFVQLLNTSLHFTNNTFFILTFLQKVLDQPLFLNPHTKLEFNSDNSYFYCILPKKILDKFSIIKDLFRFVQTDGLNSQWLEALT